MFKENRHQAIFKSTVNHEYEWSDARTLEDFLSNPSPDALQAALEFSLTDGIWECIGSDEELIKAAVKASKTGDFTELGKVLFNELMKTAHNTLECIDMPDIKAEDMEADYMAVDNLSRLRDAR